MALDEACNAGPGFMHRSIVEGTWRVSYVRETIRLGLIGGGLEPTKALKLVRTYVDDRPLAESILTAEAILMAAIVGAPEEDEPKKPQPEAETQTLSQTGG